MDEVKPVGGVLDCYKVACFWCDRVAPFFPPADTAPQARVLAKAAGWRETPKGWHCPGCVKSRKAARAKLERNTQVTLPGFGHLSRNAK